MSFRLCFLVPGDMYVLTGYMGRDGRLYWSTTEVMALYPANPSPGDSALNLKLSDIMIPPRDPFWNQMVLPHEYVVRLGLTSEVPEIKAFMEQLDNPMSIVYWIQRNEPTHLQNPTCLLLNNPSLDLPPERDMLTQKCDYFSLWLFYFRLEVMEKVYHLVCKDPFDDTIDCEAFLEVPPEKNLLEFKSRPLSHGWALNSGPLFFPMDFLTTQKEQEPPLLEMESTGETLKNCALISNSESASDNETLSYSETLSHCENVSEYELESEYETENESDYGSDSTSIS